jgi:hypothetical protein
MGTSRPVSFRFVPHIDLPEMLRAAAAAALAAVGLA